MKHLATTLAILALSGLPAHAGSGSDKASMTFRISGFVPVICRVQLATSVGAPDEDGIAQLGVAQEFCNAPRGYTVYVNHPADLEGAAVISQGVRIPLSPSGQTILTDSSHAAIRQVDLAIDLGDEPDRFRSIGVRIEARG